jgi:hypothetical protein
MDINNKYTSNQSGLFNQQLNNQKQLQNERQKLEYKYNCEQALDRIAHDFTSATKNKLDNWILNSSDKASVIRYYKRYWDNQFLLFALLIGFTSFILSFYTNYAFLSILIVFLLRELYSQKIFLTYYLNDHELTRKQISDIKNMIFYKQLKTISSAIFTVVLMLISFGSHTITNTVFTTPYLHSVEVQEAVKTLSKFYPFHVENELFAYVNIGSILILILLKLYEKWSK